MTLCCLIAAAAAAGTTPAISELGSTIVLSPANVVQEKDTGVYSADVELSPEAPGGNAGDLYFNRDSNHSNLDTSLFPGLVRVVLEGELKEKGLDFPNMLFPLPVFGNCSRAMTAGPLWRSLPRALVTFEAARLNFMYRLYRTNQVWVFPMVDDVKGKYGDIMPSVTPYWLATEGRSWSDQPYLKAALEISRSLKPEVKEELVKRGLLSAQIQSILRRSLKGVETEEDYLSAKAHPTALPPNGVDMDRLKRLSSELTVDKIAPLALITGLAASKTDYSGKMPEVTYVTPCAAAFVLRGEEKKRSFLVRIAGGEGFAMSVVHGDEDAAKFKRVGNDAAEIEVERSLISATNRVDVAIFTRSATSDWSAPSYISFSVIDKSAKYVDPVMTGEMLTEETKP